MSLSETVETILSYKNLPPSKEAEFDDDAESDLTSLSSASGSRGHTPEPSKHPEQSTTASNGRLIQADVSLFESPGQRRIVNTYGRKGRSKSFSSKSGPSGPTSAATTPRSSPRKALVSSPLTPLSSSPSKSPRKRVMIDHSPESPSKRRRLREILPESEFSTSPTHSPRKKTSSHQNGHQPAPRANKSAEMNVSSIRTTLPFPSSPTSSRRQKEEWKLESIGKLVWVRIDQQGKVPNSKSSQITFWWPGKLDNQGSMDSPLHATLFCPPSFVKRQGTVEVKEPSSQNIMSHATPLGQLRFSSSTFMVSSEPAARCPGDIRALWDAAVRSLKQEDMNADTDEFPSLLSTVLLSTVSNKGLSKRPRKSSATSATVQQLSTEDESLTIPGELVLARDNSHRKEYWPARLEEYKAPSETSTKGKYYFTYLNGEKAWITRDRFFLSHEDGFGTCKMGTWESKVKQTENDSEEMELIRWEILGSERAHSPEPVTPPPNNFSGLPMDEQFAYLKPVLKCILDGQFQPAKQRHEGFLKGGTERSNVAMMAGLRGDLDAHTVSVLSAYICRWVLRDDTFIKRSPGNGQQTQGLDSTEDASSPIAPELPPSSPPAPPSSLPNSTSEDVLNSNIDETVQLEDVKRLVEDFTPIRKEPQSGCEDFEGFSKREKMEYCLNVLLPEAVIQLLLWRAEKRTSLELLSEAEERDLHEQGMKYATAVDFVHTIKHLRHLKEQMLARREGRNVTSSVPSSGGTRSRPRLINT